ncbi:P-loop containing nucleoside triphosphate hydrolase protein [Multifurca ochricompacta]|uniref:Peroxisomal ATPase PEX1 n=1 Tax=Multifurca ochricompacta TaxID=376703 RepID=A0AAD4M4Y3_9AGAM|nr:P-loop containing nucleoside triphosphate hydrolase protein [Multifurca ochricompacta]
MPRQARLHFLSLKSSLVNLPISLFGPLLERNIATTTPSPELDGKRLQAYVGWTGMVSASSLAHFNSSSSDNTLETVEIDPQYAEGLGFKKGDVVEIGLLYDLPQAKSVATEPLTPDDWEILELHAEHVESTLLSQVRVASSNQEVDVWVLGRTRIRLRVSIQRASCSSRQRYRALCRAKDPPPAKPREAPCSGVLLRVLPVSVLPYHLPTPLGLAPFVYVSEQMLRVARLEGSLPSDPNYTLVGNVKRLSPPTDPTDSSPPPKTLNPSEPTVKREDVKEELGKNSSIRVIGMDGVPEGQIIIVGGVDGAEDWDVIRFVWTYRLLLHRRGYSTIPLARFCADLSQNASISPPPHGLAGVDDLLTNCHDFGTRMFALYEAGAVAGLSGLLVTGRTGAGKTSVAQATSKALQWDSRVQAFTLYVDLSRYTEKSVPTLRTQFQFWLDKAMWHRPSVLIFDNLEKLLGTELEHADSFRARHLTEPSSALHPLLSATHLFKQVVHLKPPEKNARKQILARIVQLRLETAINLEIDAERPLNFAALATETEGYSATDLKDLVAGLSSGDAGKVALIPADFKAAQIDFLPLSLRDVPLQKSTVEWADIGGLAETRQTLRETLEWPTKYAAIFAQSPLRLRSGLLLYGYPGCGKTLLASAAAKECGLNFISIKGPDEKSVRDIFERASAAKPCVLFFDEFDSIAPKRGHDSTGVTDRVVNQLLTLMDGAEGLDGVYVLAATSRPDLIDSALLRPGRLDKSLLCNMPTKQERKEILQAHARKVPIAPDALLYNAHLEVVHASVGEVSASASVAMPSSKDRVDDTPVEYTSFGGPVQNTVKSRAEQIAIQRRNRAKSEPWFTGENGRGSRETKSKPYFSSQPYIQRSDFFSLWIQREICDKHLRQVLKNTRPYAAFVSDRSGELPIPPDAGGVGQRVSLM